MKDATADRLRTNLKDTEARSIGGLGPRCRIGWRQHDVYMVIKRPLHELRIESCRMSVQNEKNRLVGSGLRVGDEPSHPLGKDLHVDVSTRYPRDR